MEDSVVSKICLECGTEFVPGRKHESDFCATPCRAAFNNRRMQRGAELYDLFMTMRYDRNAAVLYKLWSLICRMAHSWREDDIEKRGGRKSYRAYQRIQDRFGPYREMEIVRRKGAKKPQD